MLKRKLSRMLAITLCAGMLLGQTVYAEDDTAIVETKSIEIEESEAEYIGKGNPEIEKLETEGNETKGSATRDRIVSDENNAQRLKIESNDTNCRMDDLQENTKPIKGAQDTLPMMKKDNLSVKSDTKEVADLSDFSNTLGNLPIYGSTSNSYIEKIETGYRAVLVDGKVHIFDFDNNWNQTSEKTIEYELPIWGGYYSGEHYNYLVFGQKGSSAGTEIYRVVKYDKDFTKLAFASVLYEDCYTAIPFDAGNVSIAENGNHMVVYTSRIRPDGHQSNIALRINTDTMTIDNKSGMGAFPDIHVSHSFRQIVKYDGDNPVYVDLGDGYPRAVCLQAQPGIYTNMLDIAGQVGDNYTETDVSGVEISDTGYLVVGTQVRNYCNNIYLSYAEKESATARVIFLTASTTYNYSNVCNAKIIKITDGNYAVMWNNYDNGGSVDYVMVNGQGELISERKSVSDMELTQCEPILENGKVTWLKYSNGIRKVCSLEDFSCEGEYDWGDTYVEPVNPWDGSVNTTWYKEGVVEFSLKTPQQLAGLAQLVNDGNTFEDKKIVLENDIFFNEIDSGKNSWIPIGVESSGNTFEGTFDGKGHTLYNLFIGPGEEIGFFGVIGTKGTVKAIKVSQGYLEGAAIAYENNGQILFCQNSSYIIIDNQSITSCAGGICCENKNLIYGCGNTGVILGIGYDAAGIVGQSRELGSTIDSCWNQGSVTSTGFASAGIVAFNYGWVYDCYNGGFVSGHYGINTAKTIAGIAGDQYRDSYSRKKIYNCYNTGILNANTEDYWWFNNDTIVGADGINLCTNVYALASEYNHNATVVTVEELQSKDAIKRLQGDKIITKWCMDNEQLNNGCIIPIAQQDMKNGVYKMLPDVWYPRTEVTIKIEDGDYQLKAYQYAYYGIAETTAVYKTDSDILSITSEGLITPLKPGTAIVRVVFEESEHAKESGFDVKVTVEGSMPEKKLPFTDVKETDWYYSAVKYVYENGLITGTSDTTFSPKDPMTRGMLVSVLYRLAGRPSVSGKVKFPDVGASKYYAKAIQWASENGIVSGYSDGNFGPEDPITREQMTKIFYQFVKLNGGDVSHSADVSVYKDADQIAPYAARYVKWAVADGILKGSNGKLNPKGNATRAEVAAIMKRVIETYDLK